MNSGNNPFRRYLFLITGALLAAGIFQRFFGMERTPEYDELYTLHFFAMQEFGNIFRDVATPNNHTLNSAIIKSFLFILRDHAFLALRLGAFLAGIGLLFLSLYAFCRIPPFKKSYSGLIFLAFTACNGALCHYSQTGRGYSLQALLVTLSAFLLLYLLREKRGNLPVWAGCLLFSAGALGTYLAVSTGVLFIMGLILGASFLLFVQYWKKKQGSFFHFLLQKKWLLAAFFSAGVLALLYYLPLYKEFMKGTGFGRKLDFSFATLRDTFHVIDENDLILPLCAALISLLFCRKNREWILFFLIAGVFPFVSGFFFRSGPPRVYVPAIPLFLAAGALGAGALLDKEKGKKRILTIAFSALLVFSFLYHSPRILSRLTGDDLGMTFTEISGKLPMEIYPVFPPVNSFALEILYGENALNQMISRLEHCQALLLPGRGIHCSDLKSGASLVFPVPERIRMVKSFSLGGVEKWNLFPLEGLRKEPGEYEYIFFLGRNLPLEEMRLLPEGKKFINFRQNSFRKEGGSFLCLLPGKDVKYSLARLRKMEEKSSGCFRCLVFRENSISAR